MTTAKAGELGRPALTIVVSGPSGAGKSTLCEEFTRRHETVELMVTTTTRPIRPSEVDGVDYHFVSQKDFEVGIKGDEFLEYAKVHGHFYGSPRRKVAETWNRGNDVILEIDVQGGMTVSQKVENTLLLFVVTSDLKELRRRLVGRGTDDKESIRVRLETARTELERLNDYHYFIFNDDKEEALIQFERIVEAERWRIARYDVRRIFNPALLDAEDERATNPQSLSRGS